MITPEVTKLVSGRAVARPQVPSSVLFCILPHRKSLKQIFNFSVYIAHQYNYYYLCLLIAALHSFPLCICLPASVPICQPDGTLLSDFPSPGSIWSVGGQDNGCGQFGLTTSGEQPMLICWGRPGAEKENRISLELGLSWIGVNDLDF